MSWATKPAPPHARLIKRPKPLSRTYWYKEGCAFKRQLERCRNAEPYGAGPPRVFDELSRTDLAYETWIQGIWNDSYADVVTVLEACVPQVLAGER